MDEVWWCNTHKRRATAINRHGKHCCASGQAGILLPCEAGGVVRAFIKDGEVVPWTVETLKAFEKDIAACYDDKQIRAPIHLDGGNEEQLIEIFKGVKSEDWVCGSWRMHYKCLLKSVSPAQLKRDILAGHSITLCYPGHRIISSAIVGGILPIALGIAWAIKRAGGKERVWCFLGDMTSATGIFTECGIYAQNFELPIKFVIEDNGKSVCTPTEQAWGKPKRDPEMFLGYHYSPIYPHAGAGKRVEF